MHVLLQCYKPCLPYCLFPLASPVLVFCGHCPSLCLVAVAYVSFLMPRLYLFSFGVYMGYTRHATFPYPCTVLSTFVFLSLRYIVVRTGSEHNSCGNERHQVGNRDETSKVESMKTKRNMNTRGDMLDQCDGNIISFKLRGVVRIRSRVQELEE